MAKIMAVANQKGGVWKTSTAVSLGAAFAAMGEKILLVDMDPSGDLTAHCGVELQDGDTTIYEVITQGVPIRNAIRTLTRERTGIAYDVIGADAALNDLQGDAGVLEATLSSVTNAYDRIIIDTAPSVATPTIAALAAADEVIIPAMPHYLSLAAIQALQTTVDDMRRELGTRAHVTGVVWTNHSERSTYNKEVVEALDARQMGLAFDTTISPAIAAAEAAAEGLDIQEYIAATPKRRRARTAAQYAALASEIRNREAH